MDKVSTSSNGSLNALTNMRGFVIILTSFLLCLYLAWMANAQIGYGFSWLYQHYEIQQHVQKFAPQNRYRKNYELTTSEQQKQHFQQIVDSVHSNGHGLSQIKYQVANKQYALLHEAEVIHLQDVANLINKIHLLAALCFLLWLALFAWHYYGEKKYPRYKVSRIGLALVLLFVLAVIACVFIVFGAKEIFYQMHIWVFPEDHQWFFYYQESLMSTLMKAPDLFAGIAMQIVVLATVLYLSLFKLHNLLRSRVRKAQGW